MDNLPLQPHIRSEEPIKTTFEASFPKTFHFLSCKPHSEKWVRHMSLLTSLLAQSFHRTGKLVTLGPFWSILG